MTPQVTRVYGLIRIITIYHYLLIIIHYYIYTPLGFVHHYLFTYYDYYYMYYISPSPGVACFGVVTGFGLGGRGLG